MGKKLLSALLCFILIVSLLTGCGKKKQDDKIRCNYDTFTENGKHRRFD